MAIKDFFKGGGASSVKNMSLTDVILITGLSLIIFQAIGLVFGKMIGLTIKLGPVFILIPLLISSFLGVVVLKRLMNREEVGRTDMFSIVIVTIVALIVLFMLKGAVPEIFAAGLGQLQSMVGLG